MCLILFAYKTHPDYKLIVAANRDEYHQRPTGVAHWRGTSPNILAGIDHYAGGTWMGITECGRFSALTNYRDPQDIKSHKASRGKIVYDFLISNLDALSYSSVLSETAPQYNGYNLLYGKIENLCYYSNKTDKAFALQNGIYGLSNHLLDTEWPKVTKGKQMLAEIISNKFTTSDLLNMLSNSDQAEDDKLPDTGVGIEKERMLSPMFIKGENYRTRSSSVLLVDNAGEVSFTERTYNSNYDTSDVEFRFTLQCSP